MPEDSRKRRAENAPPTDQTPMRTASTQPGSDKPGRGTSGPNVGDGPSAAKTSEVVGKGKGVEVEPEPAAKTKKAVGTPKSPGVPRATTTAATAAAFNAFEVGGKAEKDAMKKGFDDAADKDDAMAMYEAGLLLLQKMQKIIDRSDAKIEGKQERGKLEAAEWKKLLEQAKVAGGQASLAVSESIAAEKATLLDELVKDTALRNLQCKHFQRELDAAKGLREELVKSLEPMLKLLFPSRCDGKDHVQLAAKLVPKEPVAVRRLSESVVGISASHTLAVVKSYYPRVNLASVKRNTRPTALKRMWTDSSVKLLHLLLPL
uniref:Uncharacterized protein n=1 Tax=Oryza punctata TaxID=4537 RepID=A0A0E0LAQ2_ORYPU